jgi:hypothetical protein
MTRMIILDIHHNGSLMTKFFCERFFTQWSVRLITGFWIRWYLHLSGWYHRLIIVKIQVSLLEGFNTMHFVVGSIVLYSIFTHCSSRRVVVPCGRSEILFLNRAWEGIRSQDLFLPHSPTNRVTLLMEFYNKTTPEVFSVLLCNTEISIPLTSFLLQHQAIVLRGFPILIVLCNFEQCKKR